VLLDNIVVALRVRLDYYYAKRKVEDPGAAGGGSIKQALYEFKWYENVINNRPKPFLCLIYIPTAMIPEVIESPNTMLETPPADHS
jgi:hypothetical protein